MKKIDEAKAIDAMREKMKDEWNERPTWPFAIYFPDKPAMFFRNEKQMESYSETTANPEYAARKKTSSYGRYVHENIDVKTARMFVQDLKTDKHKRQTALISMDDISYIQQVNDYQKIVETSGKCWLIHKTLKKTYSQLPPSFCMVHRSFVVNLKNIDRYFSDNIQMICGKTIPVTKNGKKEFDERSEHWIK